MYLTHIKVRKNAKIRNRYNLVPHLTQDNEWESDKNTRKYHIQESQEAKPFPTDKEHISQTQITKQKEIPLWNGQPETDL